LGKTIPLPPFAEGDEGDFFIDCVPMPWRGERGKGQLRKHQNGGSLKAVHNNPDPSLCPLANR
jgi:hypothetical protein